ncbi:MAG: hypothetical protein IJF12_01480 [Alphaproteobacteria bacterium]|nr:hypothetical protein [Alphaproteobacteria bacterium]
MYIRQFLRRIALPPHQVVAAVAEAAAHLLQNRPLSKLTHVKKKAEQLLTMNVFSLMLKAQHQKMMTLKNITQMIITNRPHF